MKKLLLSISLTLIAATSFGQMADWGTNFDPPYFQLYFSNRFYVDTVANPNCKWQIGHPAKTVFNEAHSIPNALVTDTLNALPPNDTSVIYVKHFRYFQPFHVFVLHFNYQMDGDSTDFGTIEISPDGGQSWVNLLIQDTTFQMIWISPKPTLTGSTSSWQSFDLDMQDWASGWGTFPINMTADTILFRFTYITDSNSNARDGWMIDDLNFEDWWEGIEEFKNDNLISISPNPTSDELRIYTTKISDKHQVQILNYAGQVLYANSNFIGETIDTRQFANGIYLLKYSDTKYFSVKRFVVQH
jgi:hypothetical protein